MAKAKDGPTFKITQLSGAVSVQSSKDPTWRAAKKGETLSAFVKVNTGNRSTATLKFDDGSTLKMRERSLLVVYPKGTSRNHLKLAKQRNVFVEIYKKGGLKSLDALAKTAKGDKKMVKAIYEQVGLPRTPKGTRNKYNAEDEPVGFGPLARGRPPNERITFCENVTQQIL